MGSPRASTRPLKVVHDYFVTYGLLLVLGIICLVYSVWALLVYPLLPGKTTIPHNHDTWAVIAAIEGAELNRIYRRTDDGSDPERASLELSHEVVVRPGVPIAFLPDDIHSIHVGGAEPTLHFHLYGRPLETLTGRLGFETDTGVVVRYNAKHMQRQTQAVG